MTKYRLVAPCFFGAEKTLSFEIKRAGGEDISVSDGRVYFTGNKAVIAACNINLRCGERVLILLKTFTAETFDDLFDGVFAVPFEEFIPRDGRFPVKGASLSSVLSSVPSCQSIVKKAVVKRLQMGHKTEFLPENGRQFSLRFSIRKNIVEVFLDTSGEGLHKRGYRRNAMAAPIRETLAAAIVDQARIYPDSKIFDPCCGSGTLLIEAAQKALRIAPGLNRSFAAERNGFIPHSIWTVQREEALSYRITEPDFLAVGYDIDTEALSIAMQNAEQAGVADYIRFEEADLFSFKATAKSVILANPPYGERLGEEEEAKKIISALGHSINGSGAAAYIISPEPEFETLFAAKADRRRKLYNGMLSCQLFMYYKNATQRES